MKAQVPILTVNGHEEFWLDQVQQQFQLFLTAMPVNMDLRYLIVKYLSPLLEKVIHRPIDHRLVTRYRRCRNKHGVAAVDMNLGMVPICYADQS